MIRPLKFNIASNVDIFVAILAPLLLFVTMFTGRKNMFWNGGKEWSS
jgi:hypothetical protein